MKGKRVQEVIGGPKAGIVRTSDAVKPGIRQEPVPKGENGGSVSVGVGVSGGVVNRTAIFVPVLQKRRHSDRGYKTGWKAELLQLISENAGECVDGRTASQRTRQLTEQSLFNSFSTLHEDLRMTPMPRNLGEKHVRHLVQHWWLTQKKQLNTIKTDLSILRKLARWIGKPDMVRALEVYLPDIGAGTPAVNSAEPKSEGWTANGIDVEKKIGEAFYLDARFGLILLAQLAFGLSAAEALTLQPWKADDGAALYVSRPGRDGHGRLIPFAIPEQRIVLDFIKQRIKKTEKLGWMNTRNGKTATLESNMQRYFSRMKAIGITKRLAGVTGDSLRVEFTLNMAAAKGSVSTTGYSSECLLTAGAAQVDGIS